MIVSIIAAMTPSKIVGKDNIIPWKSPEDMKFFKEKTLNHVIIMGRKTWESLRIKPLPNRYNIVVTRNTELHNSDMESELGPTFVPSVEDALNYADSMTHEVFIIGGSEIWKHSLDQGYIDRMYINIIKQEYEGNVYFPYFNEKNWLVQKNDGIFKDFDSFTLFRKKEEE